MSPRGWEVGLTENGWLVFAEVELEKKTGTSGWPPVVTIRSTVDLAPVAAHERIVYRTSQTIRKR